MIQGHDRQLCWFGAGLCTLLLLLSGSVATAQTIDANILEKLAALEARIAALETENRAYKRDAAEAKAQAKKASEKSPALLNANAAVPAQPTLPAGYKSPSPDASTNDWTGAYWGVSAGGGVSRGSITSSERISNTSAGNSPPFNVNGLDMLGNAGPSKGGGVLMDLFAGWNAQFSRIVVGGQIEATATNLSFSSPGSKTYRYFDANGPTGQIAFSDFRPQMASRWMASVLLRAGVLVTDRTLIYGIGGWTLGQFEARNITDNLFYQPNESFLANGWTAGAGIERKLDSSWSIRAEYRYIDLGSTLTSDRFNFQSVGGGVAASAQA